MKNITLKNGELQDTIQFLDGMVLKGKDSRARSRMVAQFTKPFEELYHDEQQLLKDHDMLNDDQTVKTDDQLVGRQDDVRAFKRQQTELYEESVIVEGLHNSKYFDNMVRVLNEYTGELSGRDAYIYDLLLSQLEEEETND